MKSCIIDDVVWAAECDCGRDDVQFFFCYGCTKMWCTECFVALHQTYQTTLNLDMTHRHNNGYKIVAGKDISDK